MTRTIIAKLSFLHFCSFTRSILVNSKWASEAWKGTLSNQFQFRKMLLSLKLSILLYAPFATDTLGKWTNTHLPVQLKNVDTFPIWSNMTISASFKSILFNLYREAQCF